MSADEEGLEGEGPDDGEGALGGNGGDGDAPQAKSGAAGGKKKRQWQKVDTADHYRQWLEANPPQANAAKGRGKGKGKGGFGPDGEGGPRGKGKGGGYGGGAEFASGRPEDDATKPPLGGQGDPAAAGGYGCGAAVGMEGDPSQPGGKPMGGKGRKGGGKGRDGPGKGGGGGCSMGGKAAPGPCGAGGCPMPLGNGGGKGLGSCGRGFGKGGGKGPKGFQGEGMMPLDGCGGCGCGGPGPLHPGPGGGAFLGPGGGDMQDGRSPGGCPPRLGMGGCPGGPKGGLPQAGLGLSVAGVAPYGGFAAAPAFGAYGPGAGLQVPYGMPAMYAMQAMPYYVMSPAAAPLAPGPPTPFVGAPLAPGSPTAAAPGGPAPIPPAVPTTPADRQALKHQVQGQVEYYFGQDNLIKDVYLRTKMSKEGWVPVDLLLGFRRMQQLTADLNILLEAIAASPKLELDGQGTNVRLRTGWEAWPLQTNRGPGSPTAEGVGFGAPGVGRS